MAVELREPAGRSDEDALLRELESLWDATPADAHDAPLGRRLADAAYAILARSLAWGWPATLVGIFVFAPAPAPETTYATWVVGASVALLLGPAVAGLFALKGWTVPAVTLATGLGGLGIAVGIACRATAHHSGAWWLAETGMFAALTVLGAACLACVALRARA